jgi:hypothetical protein
MPQQRRSSVCTWFRRLRPDFRSDLRRPEPAGIELLGEPSSEGISFEDRSIKVIDTTCDAVRASLKAVCWKTFDMCIAGISFGPPRRTVAAVGLHGRSLLLPPSRATQDHGIRAAFSSPLAPMLASTCIGVAFSFLRAKLLPSRLT